MKKETKTQIEFAKKLDAKGIRENLKLRKIKNISIAKRLNRNPALVSKALKGNAPVTLLRIFNLYIKDFKNN